MSFDALLINTCDLIRISIDKWNRPTEHVTADVKCRIEYGHQLVRDFKGEHVLSTAVVFFEPDVTIDHKYKIRFGSVDHAIINIQRPQNGSSIHHIEVLIK